MKKLTTGLVDPLVGVGTEKVPLRLQKIGRKAAGAVSIEERERGTDTGSWHPKLCSMRNNPSNIQLRTPAGVCRHGNINLTPIMICMATSTSRVWPRKFSLGNATVRIVLAGWIPSSSDHSTDNKQAARITKKHPRGLLFNRFCRPLILDVGNSDHAEADAGAGVAGRLAAVIF